LLVHSSQNLVFIFKTAALVSDSTFTFDQNLLLIAATAENPDLHK